MDEWLKQMTGYLSKDWGLKAKAASQFALLYAYLWMYGLNPRITSGKRDAAKQRQMREAWDRGDRQGLRARPAAKSTHTEGVAIDIVSSDERKAADIAKALGIRAGYYFKDRDPGHYDLGPVV